MKTHSRQPLALRAALAAGLAGLIVASQGTAGPLVEYTGYSRPATIELDKSRKLEKKIVPVEWGKRDPKAAKELGATVYFMVLDRENGKEGDRWGTGIENFDNRFLVSRDSPRARVDYDARYLYLYQVINDSGLSGYVYSASVRLLVDPRMITSWGHFRGLEGKKEVQGVSFALPAEAKKGEILPLSFEPSRQGVTTQAYGPRAGYHLAPKIYDFRPFTLVAGADRVAAAAGGNETGIAPDKVLLVHDARFDEVGQDGEVAPRVPRYRLPVRGEGDVRLAPSGDWSSWSWARNARIRGLALDGTGTGTGAGLGAGAGAGAGAGDGDARGNATWPVIRAYWQDEPLTPGERSTLFGFTSNAPPAFDAAQVSERPTVRAAAGDGGGAGGGAAPAAGGAGAGAAPAAGLAPAASGAVPTAVTPAAAVTEAAAEGPGGAGGGTGGLASAGSGGGGAGGLGSGSLGGLGGFSPGGGGGATGGGGVGGIGGGRGGGSLGGGGGLSGGGGSGSGQMSGNPNQNQTPDQNQNQNQGQITGTTVTINNQNQAVAVSSQAQAQAQLQAQSQSQRQSQTNGGDGNVIPAPPAWLLGLLGLPAFYFLAKRRRAKSAPQTQTPQADPTA